MLVNPKVESEKLSSSSRIYVPGEGLVDDPAKKGEFEFLDSLKPANAPKERRHPDYTEKILGGLFVPKRVKLLFRARFSQFTMDDFAVTGVNDAETV
jgi:hypothetical protein